MLKFGMPTLIELPDCEDCAALCRELGLDFIELNMNLPQYQPGRINTDCLLRLGEQHDVFYTLHLDDNMNVADFNPLVANAYEDTVLEGVNLAKHLGIPVLNMHILPAARISDSRNACLRCHYYFQGLQSFPPCFR